jgi:hypothetical protein
VPDHAEVRVAEYTELVATAISKGSSATGRSVRLTMSALRITTGRLSRACVRRSRDSESVTACRRRSRAGSMSTPVTRSPRGSGPRSATPSPPEPLSKAVRGEIVRAPPSTPLARTSQDAAARDRILAVTAPAKPRTARSRNDRAAPEHDRPHPWSVDDPVEMGDGDLLNVPACGYFLMPPVGFEPTTFGLKVIPIQVFWAVHAVLECAEFG